MIVATPLDEVAQSCIVDGGYQPLADELAPITIHPQNLTQHAIVGKALFVMLPLKGIELVHDVGCTPGANWQAGSCLYSSRWKSFIAALIACCLLPVLSVWALYLFFPR